MYWQLAHMNEATCTYEWGKLHIWMAHMNGNLHIWISDILAACTCILATCTIDECYVLYVCNLHTWTRQFAHSNCTYKRQLAFMNKWLMLHLIYWQLWISDSWMQVAVYMITYSYVQVVFRMCHSYVQVASFTCTNCQCICYSIHLCKLPIYMCKLLIYHSFICTSCRQFKKKLRMPQILTTILSTLPQMLAPWLMHICICVTWHIHIHTDGNFSS